MQYVDPTGAQEDLTRYYDHGVGFINEDGIPEYRPYRASDRRSPRQVLPALKAVDAIFNGFRGLTQLTRPAAPVAPVLRARSKRPQSQKQKLSLFDINLLSIDFLMGDILLRQIFDPGSLPGQPTRTTTTTDGFDPIPPTTTPRSAFEPAPPMGDNKPDYQTEVG
jgi:hypothetical protein